MYPLINALRKRETIRLTIYPQLVIPDILKAENNTISKGKAIKAKTTTIDATHITTSPNLNLSPPLK